MISLNDDLHTVTYTKAAACVESASPTTTKHTVLCMGDT